MVRASSGLLGPRIGMRPAGFVAHTTGPTRKIGLHRLKLLSQLRSPLALRNCTRSPAANEDIIDKYQKRNKVSQKNKDQDMEGLRVPSLVLLYLSELILSVE